MDYSPALNPNRPHLNIAIAGHAGAGKTLAGIALTKRISQTRSTPLRGLQFLSVSDRIQHVTPKGTSIGPRIVTSDFMSAYRHYSLYDFPGTRTQISSAAVVIGAADAVLLVVNAVQGPMAQTREHALLARIFQKRQLLVFISHCDRVKDAEQIDLCEIETREVLSSVGFDGDDVQFFRGSSTLAIEGDPLWTSALDELLAAFDRDFSDPPRAEDGVAEARILHRYDRAVPSSRTGLIVELLVTKGVLEPNMPLVVWGRRIPGYQVTLREFRVFDEKVSAIGAGDIATVWLEHSNDGFPRRRSFRRGYLLTSPRVRSSTEIEIKFSLIASADGGRHTPLAPGAQAIFNFQGLRSVGRLLPLTDQLQVYPGTAATAKVTLQRAVPLQLGQVFALQDGSDGFQRKFGGGARWGGTIGEGEVTAIRTPENTIDPPT